MKLIIIIFMLVGSTAGSYLPVLWGSSFFSVSSILLSAVGGIAGVYIGYKLCQYWGIE